MTATRGFLLPVAALLLCSSGLYVAASPPEPGSLDDQCRTTGALNRWREQIQGERYWRAQVEHLSAAAAKWERYPRETIERREAMRQAKAQEDAVLGQIKVKTAASTAEASEKMFGSKVLLAVSALREEAGRLEDQANTLEREAYENLAITQAPQRIEALNACVSMLKQREGL